MRGGISYVTLMVLNPIIILFYQNCSVIPAERAMAQKPVSYQTQRAPASVPMNGLKDCAAHLKSCPVPVE